MYSDIYLKIKSYVKYRMNEEDKKTTYTEAKKRAIYKYRATHPGCQKETTKKWQENNPEKLKEYMKSYYEKNKERLLEKAREHYKAKTKDKNIQKLITLLK